MVRKTASTLSTALGLGFLMALLLMTGMPSVVAETEEVITIAEARGLPVGTTVTVEGIVTVAAGSYNAGFAIQDPTAGIYVYPDSFVDLHLGDTVIVTGPLESYNCLLQIAPVPGNVQVTGAAPVPDPKSYATGAIDEASEGWLVVITGTVSSLAANSFNLNDGSGAAYVYIDTDTGISLAGIANGDNVRVTGLSSQYDPSPPCNSGWQVMPRQQSDLYLIDATPPTVLDTVPQNGQTNVNPHKPIYATFSEALDPTTVNASTFLVTVTASGQPVAGTVTYNAAAHQAVFTPSTYLSPYQQHTARLTTGIEDLAGNALAADYVWSFYAGARDTTAPSITSRDPDVDATDVSLSTNIIVTFSEEMNPATVVAANFTLTGPYGLVTWDAVTYDAVSYKVTLNPSGLLLPTTRYTATVGAGVTDWAGLSVPAAQRTWSFTTEAEPEMFAYHGDLHNHTSYSDGSGTPQQAFASAIACGLDFLVVTDHSYAINDAEWADTLAQADAATSASFVGLRGFEYTQGAEGHTNVYNTVRHATRALVAGCAYCDYTPNLEQGVTVEGFYHWLAITGTQAIDGAGTVMQFNHPGWINFNDWAYHPEVEGVADLEEVGNGWGTSYVFSWDEWVRSLDYGWRLGATNNSDNHNYNWGCITPHRTGVVMPDLTKDDLLEALRARRTYATEDSNYDLFFQANGYWMGAEIPNTGQIAFHLWGSDPDGEPVTLVQLYTANEQLVAEIQPNAADFDWTFDQAISPGVHYYFALIVQADGDRIVSSPIWTTDVEDVRLTDLTIQPSIPTIYNPSLLTARVSNRSQTTQTLTVAIEANGVPVGTIPVTVKPCAVGPCEDGYASLTWQSTVTGPVTVAAILQGALAGDNPDDNYRTLYMEVTDEKIPLILIDAGHNNIGVDPHGIRQFVNDMTLHGYNVLFNLDQITASDLNTETVKLLILNAYGPDPLAPEETQAVSNFVAAGGSLWLNSMSDYTGKVDWADTLAPRMNALVAAIETAAGSQIPIRFNDDEVLDGDDNNGYPWGILWHTFPVSATQGVGVNVLQIQSWSVASLVDRNGGALSQADLGADGFIMVLGDLDPGTGLWNYPNRTHNTSADEQPDAYIYQEGEYLPGSAGYDLPGQPGRLFFYGDANDPFNVFAYVAGDGKQNELFNLEAVMWLLGEPLQKMTVAEARYDPELDDTPDNLDRLVWVEGVVTASYGEFFDVLYIQDDTGGITVFAPAGTASGAVDPVFNRGDCVRVVGTVDVYQGDTELQFFETEQVHVLEPDCVYSPTLSLGGSGLMPLTTYDASLESNEGWLVVVTGTVTAKEGNNVAWLNDGSGPVRLFLDGYNGTWNDVKVGDRLAVAGMTSEDGAGQRIRVRNHAMHPHIPDDVRWLPGLHIQVTPEVDVPLGGVVTYTIVVSNPLGAAEPIEWSMVVPPAVTFGGWVVQNGAQIEGDTITWQGDVDAGGEETIVFTATLGIDPALRGDTIVATAYLTTTTTGNGVAWGSFTVERYKVYMPLVVRNW
ncbi:MAG: Ig-like domain-containing protein [Anaerolineae bacterium]|nr:Ig-like domain-containing protein [Anaerolineae bacterium]